GEASRRQNDPRSCTDMSISAWPSILPSTPRSAFSRASSTSRRLSSSRKTSAKSTIISGPPTNSPSTNCQPSSSAMMIPSSITRFVEANWNAIAAVKSAPLRKSERASATDAYEHDDEAAPRPDAIASVFGESSGRSRRISRFETTACTAPERAKPRISAHSTSPVMPNAKLSARQSSCLTATATITSSAAATVFHVPDVCDPVCGEPPARDQVLRLAFESRPAPAVTATGSVLVRQLDRAVVRGLLRWRQRDLLGVRGQAACQADGHVVGIARNLRDQGVGAEPVH